MEKKSALTKDFPTPMTVWVPMLLALTLPIFYFYYGRYNSYERFFSSPGAEATLSPYLFEWIFAIVLFGIVPLLASIGLLGTKPKESGFSLGSFSKIWLIFLLSMALIILYAWGAARFYEFQEIYPRYKLIGMENDGIVMIYYTTLIIAILFREFFFRGFLLQALKVRLGGWGAIIFTAAISSPLYLNGSPVESTLAIPLNLIFGWIAYKSGSVFYTAILSALWFIAIDWFIILGI
ncbi:MAG TPA: CPBP family intramembrane metalloprotease [Candidatus Marinimicrobia bacterium]|nr:CPBP family intramembrane metalloprotease [Candidatus Neomarinimicrobiota bacterium]